MPTRNDVITRALRRLTVVSMDEAATADQEQVAGDTLTSLLVEIDTTHGITIADDNNFSDAVFLPLAHLLAAEIAPEFSMPSPEPRSRAVIRLRSVTNPNDYTESADAEYY